MNSSFEPATGFFVEVRPRRFPWLNVILFLVTCFSTLVAGSLWMIGYSAAPFEIPDLWRHPSILLSGLPFAIAVMSILFAHEMGHYLTCRYYGVDATLPYFIPFPNPVGTMGAFIKIRSPIYDRGSLLEVGVMGPISGVVIALFALILSIGSARFVALDTSSGFLLGDPLILKVVE